MNYAINNINHSINPEKLVCGNLKLDCIFAGKNRMDWIEFFKNDYFAVDSGIVLEEVSPGKARARLLIEKRHLNAGGVAQGGCVFTLADLAMAAAANSHGVLSFSIQSDIRFLESGCEGDLLTAIAEEKLLRKSISHYHVEITNQKGSVVALFDGVCYRKQ